MRTNFSQDEDRQLVALALVYQQQQRRIEWSTVKLAMRYWHRTPLELKERLKTLKRSFGNDLSRFPPSLLPQEALPAPEPLELRAADLALLAIFGTVTPREVHQVAGARHLNVGELLPLAVDTVIRTADVRAGDVFVDVGSGIGNVVVQVALQTRARKCVGVEIRGELCARSQQLIERCELRARLLPRIVIVAGDATNVCVAARRPMNESTVVYLNNILFEAATNAHLTTQLCALPCARVVAATAAFCTRHREPCRSAFCCVWELFATELVPVSWTADLVPVFFYQRRRRETASSEAEGRVEEEEEEEETKEARRATRSHAC